MNFFFKKFKMVQSHFFDDISNFIHVSRRLQYMQNSLEKKSPRMSLTILA